MQILFHLGAHCTDDGLLIRSILKNRATLAEEGIGVPGPGRYREILGETSTALRGQAADADTESEIIEAIRDDETAHRIVLSNENFLCRNNVVLDEGGLDPKARVLFKKQLSLLKQQGVTLFFSSHVLADVDEIADIMAVLHEGKVEFEGTPESFKQAYTGNTLEEAYINCVT